MKLAKLLLLITGFFVAVLGLHCCINFLVLLNYVNTTTFYLYGSLYVCTCVCIPLLLHVKRKNAELFVQGFLAYTVLQMLFVITAMLIVTKLSPSSMKNFAAQLLFLCFFLLIFQSIVLAKLGKK